MDAVKPADTESVQEASPRSRPHWGRVLVWVVLLGLLGVLALGVQRAQRGPVAVGDRVSNFELSTFKGEQIPLESLRGKVVVLNFWASWCKPCEQEAADLEAAWRFYQSRGDVIFLGVDYVDTEPEALGYLAKFNITYPVPIWARASPRSSAFRASRKRISWTRGMYCVSCRSVPSLPWNRLKRRSIPC
jgi:cytochrome c biogenesis protein CcmG/thiol:disulfide interchange protein DsbE